MPAATAYQKTQDFTDGKMIVETVADAATDVSLEAEFTAVQTNQAAIPAIFAAATLILKGTLDFDSNGIELLQSLNTHTFFADGYGCDPTGTADSRAGIILALQAAIDAGGGEVVFGQGTYTVSAMIDMASDVTGADQPLMIRGLGEQLTELKMTGTGTGIFNMNSSYGDVQFRDLTLSTNSLATGASTLVSNIVDDTQFLRVTFNPQHSAAQAAISFGTTTTNSNFKMVECTIKGQYVGDPVSLYRTRDGLIANCIFDLSSSAPDSGIYVRSTGGSDNEGLRILNCNMRRTAGSARGTISIDDAHTNRVLIQNMDIVHTAAIPAIECGTATNVEIRGGTVDFNDNTDIVAIELLGTNILVDGLEVVGQGASCEAQAFGITSADQVQIMNCRVSDFGGTTTGDVFKATSDPTNSIAMGNNFATANNAVTYPATGLQYKTAAADDYNIT